MAVLGLPLVPDDRIVARYRRLVVGHDRRVLLLGITRALAQLGHDLTAVDFSEAQIAQLWPGDSGSRRAVLADWRSLETGAARYSAVAGDGCFSALAWPDEYRNVLQRAANALETGGRLVVRCFIAPDEREAIEAVVDDVLAGRETSRDAARWRIAMAAADGSGSIGAADLAAIWWRVFPSQAELAQRTGWDLAAMEMLFASLSRGTLRYSLVTRSAVLETLPDTLIGARFVSSGDYPLSQRCPFLVAERAG
jgi:hypothetical protein